MDDARSKPSDAWLVEHASDIVSVIRVDGIIEYESPSVERLLGWRPDELLGTQVLDYVHPDDLAHVTDAIRKRIAEPGPVNPPTEFRVRARDGSWHRLAAMSRVTRDTHGTTTLVVNSRDVTHERALEAQLREAQRLESIMQLARAAAHEINNPLAVLMGQLALLDIEQRGNPRIEKSLVAVRRIRDIVARMIRINRIETLVPGSSELPPMLDLRKSSEETRER